MLRLPEGREHFYKQANISDRNFFITQLLGKGVCGEEEGGGADVISRGV